MQKQTWVSAGKSQRRAFELCNSGSLSPPRTHPSCLLGTSGSNWAWHAPGSPPRHPRAAGPGGYSRSVTEALGLEGAGERLAVARQQPSRTPPSFPRIRLHLGPAGSPASPPAAHGDGAQREPAPLGAPVVQKAVGVLQVMRRVIFIIIFFNQEHERRHCPSWEKYSTGQGCVISGSRITQLRMAKSRLSQHLAFSSLKLITEEADASSRKWTAS